MTVVLMHVRTHIAGSLSRLVIVGGGGGLQIIFVGGRYGGVDVRYITGELGVCSLGEN